MAYVIHFDSSQGDTPPQVLDGVPIDPIVHQAALQRVTVLEGVLATIKTRREAAMAADAAKVEGKDDVDDITAVGL